jgi:AbrB family looped-hinge helix DNA binding protein
MGMHATVSNKGQVTLPKAIRDQLGLVEGTRLDLDVVDGTIRARPVSNTALGILGALHRPGMKPVSAQEMKQAIEAEASGRFTQAVAVSGSRKRRPAGKGKESQGPGA